MSQKKKMTLEFKTTPQMGMVPKERDDPES